MLTLVSFALASSPSWFGSPVGVTPMSNWGADVKTGDLNGDGLPDITVSAATAGSWYDGDRPFGLELSLSDGAGGFTFVEVPTSLLSGYTLVTDVADLDGDGLADLVAGHAQGFSVFFSDGTTLATEVDHAGLRVGAVELGDLDGDGDVDLVTVADDGTLDTWFNDGAGAFTLGQSVATAAGTVDDPDWDSVDLVDLDGDGALDVVQVVAEAYTSAAGPVAVWLNDGTGTLATTATTWGPGSGGPGEVYDLALGDIDGDGWTDFVYADFDFDVASVEWDGGFAGATTWPIASYAYSWMLTGDVDGDGDTDVVGTAGFDLGVLLQDGGALVDAGATYPFQATCGWAVADDGLELVDMNGDGCADIVGWAYGTGATIVPATGPGCTGATPTAWGSGGGADTASADTGAPDTGTAEAGVDTDTGAPAPVSPPSSFFCSVVDPRSGALGTLVVAALALARRRP